MLSDIIIHIILGGAVIASGCVTYIALHRSRISYELSQYTNSQMVILLRMTAEHFKDHDNAQ